MSTRNTMDGTPPRDARVLADVFADTRYRVLAPVDVEVTVGMPCPALERAVPAGHYGYITAHDPAACPQLAAVNDAADAALAARLRALSLAHLRMDSQAPDGSAHELGWLVLDAGDAGMDALGRAFGQAAVLGWTAGQPVVLRMMMAVPDATGPSAWVRWIE